MLNRAARVWVSEKFMPEKINYANYSWISNTVIEVINSNETNIKRWDFFNSSIKLPSWWECSSSIVMVLPSWSRGIKVKRNMSLHCVSKIFGKSNPSSSGRGLSWGIRLLNLSPISLHGVIETLVVNLSYLPELISSLRVCINSRSTNILTIT